MKNVAFPVYYNWYDWLRENLPPEERCEVTDALRDYYETGDAPEEAVRDSLRLVVSLMRNLIDSAGEKSKQASEYGKIGAKRAKEKQKNEEGASGYPEGTTGDPEDSPEDPEDSTEDPEDSTEDPSGLKENKIKDNKRKEKEIKENSSCSLSYDIGEREKRETPKFWDVWHFFRDEGLTSDARKFFKYYESVGWMDKGRPIVDWRSKAELWDMRESDFTG